MRQMTLPAKQPTRQYILIFPSSLIIEKQKENKSAYYEENTSSKKPRNFCVVFPSEMRGIFHILRKGKNPKSPHKTAIYIGRDFFRREIPSGSFKKPREKSALDLFVIGIHDAVYCSRYFKLSVSTERQSTRRFSPPYGELTEVCQRT